MLISEILRAQETPWGEERIDQEARMAKPTSDNWQWVDQREKIAIAAHKNDPEPRRFFMLDLASKSIIGVFDLWNTGIAKTFCVGNIQVKKAYAGQRFAYAFYQYALNKMGYCIRSGDAHTPASERTWVRLTSDPDFKVVAQVDGDDEWPEDDSGEWTSEAPQGWHEVRVVKNAVVYADAKGKPQSPYTGTWEDPSSHRGKRVHLFCYRKDLAPQPKFRFK